MTSRTLPAQRSVLVVEDDGKTLDTIALYLRHSGYRVAGSRDGREGLRLATTQAFDLLVLDRMLPGVDGLAVCRAVRERSEVPIVMLTAMVGEHERLEGFDAGVDDYVIKPFSPRELVARVQAVLRRAQLQGARRRHMVSAGDLVLDAHSNEAWLGDRRLELSPTEFRLLHTLASAPTRVFTRDELADRARPDRDDVDPRTIDAHVKNLRRKIDTPDGGDSLIATVFGVGYRLSSDSRRRA